VPVIVELYGEEILARYPALAPLLAQARSALWQVINALLVVAGAWAGYGWAWWQAALLLAAVLVAPHVAAEVIRRAGRGGAGRIGASVICHSAVRRRITVSDLILLSQKEPHPPPSAAPSPKSGRD
jgi:hypothetical protein